MARKDFSIQTILKCLVDTPPSKNLINIGLLAVRLGMVFVFIYAGVDKVLDPESFGIFLQNWAGIDPIVGQNMALLIGGLEILSGVLIGIGLITRIASGYQLVVLVSALFLFGFNFILGPNIWKDPALIWIAIMLLLYGSGKFSLDHRISKSEDEVQAT